VQAPEKRPKTEGDLGAVGRASRFTCKGAELWCFDIGDAPLVKRLASFGEAGVTGFASGWGEDEAGVFAVRRVPSQTLDGLGKGERLDGLSALAKLRDLARALAHCEKHAVFPGPLRPVEIALGSPGRPDAFVVADTWLRAVVGATKSATSTAPSTPSPRWTPPEQAGGAPWDNAANRYVLGLAAYRLLSGAHPFSGIGLRDAMDAQAGPPPPFDDELARTLKPGIQSFVLGMLDPDPAKRPRSAEAVAARCEELIRDEPAPAASRGPSRDGRPALQRPSPARPQPVGALRDALRDPRRRGHRQGARASSTERPRELRYAAVAAPLAFGVLALAGGVAASWKPASSSPVKSAPATSALVQAPLKKTTADACAPCHARQVAEWQRSVMAHAVKSPLFGALESVVEEQVGRDDRCPNGAGVLRKASAAVCRDEKTGRALTGTGGEHWCVNCHSAADNLASTVPAWNVAAIGGASQRPLRDVLGAQAMEGISCAVCHQAIGPVHGGTYDGNPTWTSPFTGAVFRMRPEDGLGTRGIGNSGYLLDRSMFFTASLGSGGPGDPIVHRRVPDEAARYLRSSEFCGACHDVRLFGTDSIGVRERGEHFKRLRNAYSEWKTWADAERSAGRQAATCQDCHMSLYPGVCVQDASKSSARLTSRDDGCPRGFHFEKRSPGEKARGMIASASAEPRPTSSHWFTSVDVPMASEYPEVWALEGALDPAGVPLGLEARRLQLLRRTFRFAIDKGTHASGRLEIPIEIENSGAGHRVPAGFSQERETWVELTVRDGRGDVVYEVGKLTSDDADLRDKVFLRTTTRDDVKDFKGKPQGVFGADIVDGPDVPQWSPNPTFGGTTFRGKGLLNMQNGFLRCVKCIGVIDGAGRCQAAPSRGQGRTRADRFDDGVYDLDTGECQSNLIGTNAFLETYFPVGALDADRGVAKAPDAILDQRSAAPGVVLRYTYEIDVPGRTGPFTAVARLRFRPFPPYLLRAFADYEARKAAEGLRPSGAQVTSSMSARNHPIDLAEASVKID
jgi:hypothetical protein